MTSIEERLKRIITRELEIEENQINREMTFIEDLGADSLEAIYLILAIEEEFDIDISLEEAEKIVTVGNAIDCIKEQVSRS